MGATVIEQPIPEMADGGVWYVLPATTDMRGNIVPPSGIQSEWCGVYGTIGGIWYVLVRALKPFTHPDIVSSPTANEVITAAASQGYLPQGFSRKPGMRVKDQ